MSDQDNELEGYYTIKPEKIIGLIRQVETNYYIASDNLQEIVSTTEIDKWDKTSTLELMGYVVQLNASKIFINEIINPPKNIVALAKKYQIEDFLLKKEMLLELNSHLLLLEERQAKLETEYGYKIILQ